MYGSVSYCCNLGNVTGKSINAGIVGNNRKHVSYVYNKAQIKILITENAAGGIAGTQAVDSSSYIRYAYNSGKIVGYSPIGGIVGSLKQGIVSNTYNMGILDTTETISVGQIGGHINDSTAITNSKGTTESEMKGWSQATITTNLGQFVKKENSLPILNITIRDITF